MSSDVFAMQRRLPPVMQNDYESCTKELPPVKQNNPSNTSLQPVYAQTAYAQTAYAQTAYSYELLKNINRQHPAYNLGSPEDIWLVDLMLHPKVDINVGDFWGRTDLHYAAQNGYARVVRKLLDMGADVDAVDIDDRTPLYFADECQQWGAIIALLHGGANPYAFDHFGVTAIHYEPIDNKILDHMFVRYVY